MMKQLVFVRFLSLATVLLFVVTAALPSAAEDNGMALEKMLDITWKLGPSLPHGFQDSDGGIVDNHLISVGGFCSGHSVPGNVGIPGKKDAYPRGFFKRTWGLDLAQPAAGWKRLPDLPAAERQELFSAVVDDRLYCWGGFSYSEPFAYRDGYRLSRRQGEWVWDKLPELPWAIASGGICSVGSRIYVLGGTDSDSKKLYTNTDRSGKIARLGARLLMIDTKNLEAGWQQLSQCPGTPRMVCATAAANGKIYVIGGASGNDNPHGLYCTVVDNWQYDPEADGWRRLPDLPVASGNFPSGSIVYADRYILLVGGGQYSKVLNPDGTLGEVYGTTTKHYAEKLYDSDVFVYDTKTNRFGAATPLPLNNNLPMMVVEGNRIHLIGGETDRCEIDGEHFGHHPDLYLTGTIQKAEPSVESRK